MPVSTPVRRFPSTGSMAKVAPSDIGAQSTGNTAVDQAIFSAAQSYGVPPEVLFADAQIESGLNPNAVGDQGTSFGLFQEHEGGELSTVANAVNPTYAADLAAQTFKAAQQANPNMTWGQIAAAAQRPADQAGYAAKVNAQLGTAGQMPSAQASKVLGSSVLPSLEKQGATTATPTEATLDAAITQGATQQSGYALLDSIVGSNMALPGGNGANNYENAVSQALGNPQYSSQALGALAGAAAPGIAGAGLTEAQALAQAGVAPGAIAVGAQNLALNTGYGLAQDVGTIQSNQLQQQSLASQIGTAAKQQTSEVGQYQNQLQQLGVSAAGLASQQGYLGTQEGLASSEYGVTEEQLQNQQASISNQAAQVQYELPLQLQQQQGAAAASGASNTVGNKNAQANISETAANTLQGLNLQGGAVTLQGQQAGLQEQGTQAGLQQQGAQNVFSQQSNQLQTALAGIQQQSEVQGYQGQTAQYANAQQQLKLAAQQAGIPVQQAVSQLGYGLQQLGITTDPTQYLSQAAQAQGTQASDWSAVLSAAGVIGGLGPQSISRTPGK